MLLIPRASVGDGLLDVVIMRPKGRFGWAKIELDGDSFGRATRVRVSVGVGALRVRVGGTVQVEHISA
ncbi:hypothetical protein [Microbacterium radiodurans]|uniref:hypothetical protein n=1 Tax=Microbacterium radiodurans TaxID=661398 RepID=UPI001CC4550A|nr:hypothetical protein [Microbacterium radiodurans]